jgi:predicted DsbA family dithiol-disulfide isomerase
MMKLKLAITSDIVCVWCYIGVRQLQLALEKCPWVEPKIIWHPFELNPDMPMTGVDRVEYFDRKFGSEKRLAIEAGTTLAADDAGLVLDWSKIKRQVSTRNCHVLMQIAAKNGDANALHDRLCQAHFADGLNISDEATLIRLAGEIGMSKALAKSALRDVHLHNAVLASEIAARQAGIMGVPHFVIDDVTVVNGAAGTQQWIEIFEDLKVEA